MGIQLDPINKLIKITSPTTTVTVLEIYNIAMDWCDEQENMGYTVPMRAVGKFPLGGGAYSDSIFLLQDGWKIKFWDGTYQATIIGTLITDDGTPRTVPPDSGNVEVIFQVSSQGIVVSPDIEGIQDIKTETDKIPVLLAESQSHPTLAEIDATTVLAKEATIATIKTKTEALPPDPASETTIATKIGEVKGTGFEKDVDSLTKIREYVDELELVRELFNPKSIAQALENREKTK